MIFALSDFIQWKLRRGRYGGRQKSIMGLGFEGTPPKQVIGSMRPGDLIFTQRMDRWFSWMMMYFSSSSVDHCAWYVGKGMVAHVTFSGTSKDPLRYVAKGSRLIVLRALDLREMVIGPPREPSRFIRHLHRYSAKVQLTWVAVEFALGFYPERFRWKFVADAIVLAAVIDLSLAHVTQRPILSVLVMPLLAIMLVNRCRWIIREHRKHAPPLPGSHPDLLLKPFFKSGGLMLTHIGPIVVGPFGMMPLKAAQAIAAGRSDGEAGVDDAAIREAFRDVLFELDVLEDPQDTPTSA